MQGDLYEYLLGHLQFAGRNGQFRTPRHIIRMMVQMIDPQPRERIGDLAAGTGGFLVNAYQYILEKHTSAGILEYDAEGLPHHLIGDLLSKEDRAFMASKKYLRGFDNDSGMTMLRIGSMNLMLHGIESPQFFYRDTLSKSFNDEREYDVILMNPPFKGAVDKGDVNPTLPSDTTKTELLFVHLILRALEMGGRCAGDRAGWRAVRLQPRARGAAQAASSRRTAWTGWSRCRRVCSSPTRASAPRCCSSRAARRRKISGSTTWRTMASRWTTSARRWLENDIPDVVECWQKRNDKEFGESREQRIAELREQLIPLKEERLALHEEIDELTFVKVLTEDLPEPHPLLGYPQLREREEVDPARLEEAKKELAELDARIQPLQVELDRLSRQFWVTKEQVKANKYDLSASRYRQAESDDVYHPDSSEVIERLQELNEVINQDLSDLQAKIDPDAWGESSSGEEDVEPDPDSPF